MTHSLIWTRIQLLMQTLVVLMPLPAVAEEVTFWERGESCKPYVEISQQIMASSQNGSTVSQLVNFYGAVGRDRDIESARQDEYLFQEISRRTSNWPRYTDEVKAEEAVIEFSLAVFTECLLILAIGSEPLHGDLGSTLCASLREIAGGAKLAQAEGVPSIQIFSFLSSQGEAIDSLGGGGTDFTSYFEWIVAEAYYDDPATDFFEVDRNVRDFEQRFYSACYHRSLFWSVQKM